MLTYDRPDLKKRSTVHCGLFRHKKPSNSQDRSLLKRPSTFILFYLRFYSVEKYSKTIFQKMPEQINLNRLNNINDLPIDIKIAILKKVVGSDRKELEKIQQVHPHWLFITKTNDFMTPIFGNSN